MSGDRETQTAPILHCAECGVIDPKGCPADQGEKCTWETWPAEPMPNVSNTSKADTAEVATTGTIVTRSTR